VRCPLAGVTAEGRGRAALQRINQIEKLLCGKREADIDGKNRDRELCFPKEVIVRK
jgi:hypothetical protein